MTREEAVKKLQEAVEVSLCTIRIRVEDAMQICNLLCEEGQNEED